MEELVPGEAKRQAGRVFSVSLINQPCCSTQSCCGIPQASSPLSLPMGHTCGMWHWPPGWAQSSTTAPCTVCHLWLLGYVGIIIGLLLSFQLLLYMHVSDKQSWLREYGYICKGLSHLSAMSDLHQSAPIVTFLMVFQVMILLDFIDVNI